MTEQPKPQVAKVETRDNVIGRALQMGEIGPAYLDYLRMTEKGNSEDEWARQKAEEVMG